MNRLSKIYFLFALAGLIGGAVSAQDTSYVDTVYSIRAQWDANLEPDMQEYWLIYKTDIGDSVDHYGQYKFRPDSLLPFAIIAQPAMVDVNTKINYLFPSITSTNAWLQAGVSAVDTAGNESELASSNLINLKRLLVVTDPDTIPPTKPGKVVIIETILEFTGEGSIKKHNIEIRDKDKEN